jgi:hypothetical protein
MREDIKLTILDGLEMAKAPDLAEIQNQAIGEWLYPSASREEVMEWKRHQIALPL